MDFSLTPAQDDLRRRCATLADELMAHEVECELAGGAMPPETVERIRARARELDLVGGNHAREHGGLGWSMMEHVIFQEELGRVTTGVWWVIPGAYNVLALGTPEQIDRYLRPTLTGAKTDAYAVTERDAGSDASGIQGTAVREGGAWRVRAEKWFVTSSAPADFYLVVVNALVDGERRPTIFLVDADTPGITEVEHPRFTHNYPGGHPTVAFDCLLGDEQVLGGPEGVGGAGAMQNAWFVEERIHIAARCAGAMRRLLDDTVAWSAEREQFGRPILDFQGVGFPLADSAADCVAARLLTFQVAQMVDDGAPPKLLHARASMAKLFASEAAWRCADRCVQAFGGRGYRRDNVAERFLRELRVDRIWEGTSEIQRLILVNALRKRGVEPVLDVATAPTGSLA